MLRGVIGFPGCLSVFVEVAWSFGSVQGKSGGVYLEDDVFLVFLYLMWMPR